MSFTQGFRSRPMIKSDWLLPFQANVICVLLFLVGVTALIEHPEWFR